MNIYIVYFIDGEDEKSNYIEASNEKQAEILTKTATNCDIEVLEVRDVTSIAEEGALFEYTIYYEIGYESGEIVFEVDDRKEVEDLVEDILGTDIDLIEVINVRPLV